MNTHAGGCHCGNLRYGFESALAADALPLRACQCTFCRRHGALSTSDPAGRVAFEVRDPGALLRYVFGLRTAEFLVCRNCGVYIAAVLKEGARAWAIVNANTLDQPPAPGRSAVPMDYDAETPAQRVARRKQKWTPVAGPV